MCTKKYEILMSLLNRFNLSKESIVNTLKTDNTDCIFISGSLCDELGNKKSDLDIFLITSIKNPILNNKHSMDQNLIVNDRRLDFSIFSYELIKTTQDLLNELDCENPSIYLPRELSAIASNYEIITMIHRLRVGIPVFNENKFNQLTSEFPFEKYIKWKMRIKFNEYDGNHEDFIGSIEDQDWFTASELIKQQLNIVGELLILNSRETIDREKWITRKLFNLIKKEKLSQDLFYKYVNFKNSEINLNINQRHQFEALSRFCDEQIENLQLQQIF